MLFTLTVYILNWISLSRFIKITSVKRGRSFIYRVKNQTIRPISMIRIWNYNFLFPLRQEKMMLFACNRKLPQHNYLVTNNLYISHVLTAFREQKVHTSYFPSTHLFSGWCFHHKSLSGFYFLLITEVAQ